MPDEKNASSHAPFWEPVPPAWHALENRRWGIPLNIAHTTFTRIHLGRPSAAQLCQVASANVAREPRHVERLDDKRLNRTLSKGNAVAVETEHSNLGGDKKFSAHCGDADVGYSPRPPIRVGNRRNQRVGFAAHGSAADSGVIAGDDTPCHFRSPDIGDWLSVGRPVERTWNNRSCVLTIVPPRQHTRNHNNERKGNAAGKSDRSLSTDKHALEASKHLDLNGGLQHAEMGPRELQLPTVKSRREADDFAARRFS